MKQWRKNSKTMNNLSLHEFVLAKRSLEIRLDTLIRNELLRFLEETGVAVKKVDIPIREVFELGNEYPSYYIDDVKVELDV